MLKSLRFVALDGSYSVCRFDRNDDLPDWIADSGFSAVVRSKDELSVLVSSEVVPTDVRVQREFSGFRILGTLAFSEIGIIAEVTEILAGAAVPVFVVSSFDTDYFFVPSDRFDAAVKALVVRGYDFEGLDPGATHP